MARVYLGLGTNLGNKEQNLRDVVQKIGEWIGKIISLSAFYITSPWGFTSKNNFLNTALCADSSLLPLEILKETQIIEYKMGRISKSADKVYQDRLIDIDLLLYDNLIMNTKTLILPHPLMIERAFVMKPLAEIAPKIIHPILGKTIEDIFHSIKQPPPKEVDLVKK
ncbi:MAG: 2-amino-4-hydroxy-6-hydroxymethyldihydropteridine diphosphokinase [Mediterranea sp.]|jgi:2-amino-4-hydroxy-6-hydroxymethyldihydropteridine diphosphokinase|nr:2-amino-4-hydroxy-6-hydroxymethyldihydropteridine diphosphokinase [Mediterranea sp.]